MQGRGRPERLFQSRHDKGSRPTRDRRAVSNKTTDAAGFCANVLIAGGDFGEPGSIGF
jgi:hypothetical protein